MLELKVWGDYACFTRPENKVERVSYDVMTPSAAQGVLESVFWKPEFEWRIHEIVILNEVKRFSILRNEVNSRASERTAKVWMDKGGGFNADEDRAQRHSLMLRDVAYIIRADMVLKAHATDPVAKYSQMFLRRVSKGQAHHQPYLGTRECNAFFGLPSGTEQAANVVRQLGGDYAEKANELKLGRMLFGMEFFPDASGSLSYRVHNNVGTQWVKGRAIPRFFDAVLVNGGVLRIPPFLYQQPLLHLSHNKVKA